MLYKRPCGNEKTPNETRNTGNYLYVADCTISYVSDMAEFTLEPLKTMMKKAGAKRVSDKAAAALATILEEKTAALLVQAEKLSKHAGRSTVMREDVKAARKTIGP